MNKLAGPRLQWQAFGHRTHREASLLLGASFLLLVVMFLILITPLLHDPNAVALANHGRAIGAR